MTYTQQHTDIKTIYDNWESYVNTNVEICGWVRFFRKSKSIAFARIYDGTCLETMQVVFDFKKEDVDYDDIIKRGKSGISIKINGRLVKSQGANQAIEIICTKYQIYGDVMDPDTYPIAKSEHSMEYLRTQQHLKIRTETHLAIARIKSIMKAAFATYFEKINFKEVQIPLITDNECESGANPFTVTTIMGKKKDDIPVIEDGTTIDYSKDFFKKKSYLTVSGQLHLEALVLGGLSKAYCWTTAFRAEPSLGPRHLGEFWMFELEFCFCNLEDNMAVNEGCIKFCLDTILRECGSELKFLENKFKPGLVEMLKKYATTEFIITTHEQCVTMMLADIDSGKVKINPKKEPDGDLFVFRESPGYADDLSKDHERYITEILYSGMPVFVKYFPATVKAFYMPKIDEGNSIEHVSCFDLLFPEIGEIVGGSDRESDYNKLICRMNEMSIDKSSLEYYLDLRKYGSVPHGGSGIGFDRLMMVCTGIFNIKDMVPFPRAYGLCYF